MSTWRDCGYVSEFRAADVKEIFPNMLYLQDPDPRKTFEDLLDDISEVRDADPARLEPRMARLERIVQRMLLALVEATQGEKQ
jgi:hypothetical protein